MLITLSIITVHLQDFLSLQQTFLSIQSINWDQRPQWIVIDGGSQPTNSNEKLILQQIKEFADHFVSEPDQGIYDAMNKGTGLATAEFVWYLNAGDVLHPDFYAMQLKEIIKSEQYGMIWGQCVERYENGALVKIKTRTKKSAWYGMPTCHQAMLFRRAVLADKPFELEFSMAADYELVCRLLDQGVQLLRIEMYFCIYQRGGISDKNLKIVRHEYRKIQDKYFSIPAPVRILVSTFKRFNRILAKVAWLRNLWRRWI